MLNFINLLIEATVSILEMVAFLYQFLTGSMSQNYGAAGDATPDNKAKRRKDKP